jgi:hypothetical protein
MIILINNFNYRNNYHQYHQHLRVLLEEHPGSRFR